MSDTTTTLRQTIYNAIDPMFDKATNEYWDFSSDLVHQAADAAIAAVREHLVAAAGETDNDAVMDYITDTLHESVADWITAQLTPDAAVPAPVAWWMRNLPEGWQIDAIHDDKGLWHAHVDDGKEERGSSAVGTTRDEALNAALRAALEGGEGSAE